MVLKFILAWPKLTLNAGFGQLIIDFFCKNLDKLIDYDWYIGWYMDKDCYILEK